MLGHTLTKRDIAFGGMHPVGQLTRAGIIRRKSRRELRDRGSVEDGSES